MRAPRNTRSTTRARRGSPCAAPRVTTPQMSKLEPVVPALEIYSNMKLDKNNKT